MSAIVKAIQSLGVGFGEKGKEPGQFYEFPGSPLKTGTGYSLLVPVPA